jgi:hypothetical protein
LHTHSHISKQRCLLKLRERPQPFWKLVGQRVEAQIETAKPLALLQAGGDGTTSGTVRHYELFERLV